MKNLKDKIANIQLTISKDIQKEHGELLKKYWAYGNDLKFVNTPTPLRNDLNMSQSDLNLLVQTHSSLEFYLFCGTCESMEYQKAQSQTQFKELTKSLNKQRHSHKCGHCHQLDVEKQKEADRVRMEAQKKDSIKLIEAFNKAIDEKAWKHLSAFENGVLKHAIQLNSMSELKKQYYSKGMQCFKMLFTALRLLQAENLLLLKTEHWDHNRIENYEYLPRLKNEYDYKTSPNMQTDNSSSVQINKHTNELKFKLTINKNQVYPDSPVYAGTIKFKERIVIEPHEEYAFGVWNRANEELFLTMVPLKNLDKSPFQKRMQSLPIHVKEIIEYYLNNLGKG